MGTGKYLGLGRRSLKHKMLIAFVLMSIIPLLSLAYFVTNYVFTHGVENLFQTSAVVIFALWVSFMGYVLAREIIIPVIGLSVETRIVADGQYDLKVLPGRDDELGEIATAINTMTGKMRGYIGELQEYSKETAALNVKIHRKVLTLTNLMRLGDLILSGAKFEEVTDFTADRLAKETYSGFCAIFMKDDAGRYERQSLVNNSGKDVFEGDIGLELSSIEKLFFKNEYLLIDSRPLMKSWQKKFREKLGLPNVALFPIKMKTRIIGVIMFGSGGEGIEFDKEDIEILRAFEKELVLAYQSFQVVERVKTLEVVDSVTSLYKFSYLESWLEDEINRAVYYQRPCSLILIRVDDYDDYLERYGELKAKQVLKRIGKILGESMPPIGKAARGDYEEFGILLPEKNKRESLEVAEDIRKKVEAMELSSEENDRVTVSIGVGENPIDGISAKEIIAKAREYAEKARKAGKNRVLGG